MADCGIKRYDDLPSRVGWIDVDMNRWHLNNHLHPKKVWSVKYIGPVFRFFMVPSQTKERTIELLERAYKRHHYG